ncbi:MAG: hypothetical protein QXD62_03025 [Candidatus Woesearchaeota archaeon]
MNETLEKIREAKRNIREIKNQIENILKEIKMLKNEDKKTDKKIRKLAKYLKKSKKMIYKFFVKVQKFTDKLPYQSKIRTFLSGSIDKNYIYSFLNQVDQKIVFLKSIEASQLSFSLENRKKIAEIALFYESYILTLDEISKTLEERLQEIDKNQDNQREQLNLSLKSLDEVRKEFRKIEKICKKYIRIYKKTVNFRLKLAKFILRMLKKGRKITIKEYKRFRKEVFKNKAPTEQIRDASLRMNENLRFYDEAIGRVLNYIKRLKVQKGNISILKKRYDPYNFLHQVEKLLEVSVEDYEKWKRENLQYIAIRVESSKSQALSHKFVHKLSKLEGKFKYFVSKNVLFIQKIVSKIPKDSYQANQEKFALWQRSMIARGVNLEKVREFLDKFKNEYNLQNMRDKDLIKFLKKEIKKQRKENKHIEKFIKFIKKQHSFFKKAYDHVKDLCKELKIDIQNRS